MQLKIKPHTQNQYPLNAILIKGTSAAEWLREIQRLDFSLERVRVYAVPGKTLNSVWGCLLLDNKPITVENAGKNELCQMVIPNFFIPERTTYFPHINHTELALLFPKEIHLAHPEIGIARLGEPLIFSELIAPPELRSRIVIQPETGVFIPKNIKSFQIHAAGEEIVLQQMEGDFPEKENMPNNTGLSMFERGKLAFYKALFSEGGYLKNDRHSNLRKRIEAAMAQGGAPPKWLQKMIDEYEALKQRNQKQVDKLMDLLEKNPAEALKYAIPLDEHGTSRGGNGSGALGWSNLWQNYNLFNNRPNGWRSSGGSADIGDHYFKLQQQYRQTALKLIEQGDYKKAAFVYMKLLRDYHAAAETMRKGKYYEEAATIYLKYAKDKRKAAECYEEGKLTRKAIELYKALNEHEKVGDLYMSINERERAFKFYELQINEYLKRHQYRRASLIYRKKMNDMYAAQACLLGGWKTGHGGFDCLNNYFGYIDNKKLLKSEIERIYREDVIDENANVFLKVIHYEYKKHQEVKDLTRGIAYEIISKYVEKRPQIIDYLKKFNPRDSRLNKDVFRYKNGR